MKWIDCSFCLKYFPEHELAWVCPTDYVGDTKRFCKNCFKDKPLNFSQWCKEMKVEFGFEI
jgi:hypothetical protein